METIYSEACFAPIQIAADHCHYRYVIVVLSQLRLHHVSPVETILLGCSGALVCLPAVALGYGANPDLPESGQVVA